MLPTREIIDAHHHFLDPRKNPFQSFLGSLLGSSAEAYLPENYEKDVVEPLRSAGVKVIASVHVECIPDDGYDEAQWIESLITNARCCTVGAIVASCNLADPNVGEWLQKVAKHCPHVRGVRWILDYVGPFDGGKNATHVATTRHEVGKEDYLRWTNNNSQTQILPEFEYGFSLLEKYNYTFDLQCSPEQLQAAASLFKRYPNIRVCIDHIGKPRTLLGQDDDANLVLKEKEYQCWKSGMELMSQLPNVYVKLSMLGYAVPGWYRSALIPGGTEKECPKLHLIQQLIYDIIDMFSPARCMIGLNWWKDNAMSDADGLSSMGPTPLQYIEYISNILSQRNYTEEECHQLFVSAAQQFYDINQ